MFVGCFPSLFLFLMSFNKSYATIFNRVSMGIMFILEFCFIFAEIMVCKVRTTSVILKNVRAIKDHFRLLGYQSITLISFYYCKSMSIE